jgi:hypothetical protein
LNNPLPLLNRIGRRAYKEDLIHLFAHHHVLRKGNAFSLI